MHFSPFCLYRGPFGVKVGAEIALLKIQPVWGTIWWPNDKVGAEIALFPVSIDRGPFGGPMRKVGAEIALFNIQTV